jgi:hypothetical protein
MSVILAAMIGDTVVKGKQEYTVLISFKQHKGCKLEEPQANTTLETDITNLTKIEKQFRGWTWRCLCGYTGKPKKVDAKRLVQVNWDSAEDMNAEQQAAKRRTRVTKEMKVARSLVSQKKTRIRRKRREEDAFT